MKELNLRVRTENVRAQFPVDGLLSNPTIGLLKATRLQDEVYLVFRIIMCLGNDKEEQDDPRQDVSYRAAEHQLVIIEFYCQFS